MHFFVTVYHRNAIKQNKRNVIPMKNITLGNFCTSLNKKTLHNTEGFMGDLFLQCGVKQWR